MRDFCFELWIPEVNLKGSVARKVRAVSWSGEESIEDLGGWVSHDGVELRDSQAPPHVARCLPPDFPTEGWSYLQVAGPALDSAAVVGDERDTAWESLERVLSEQLRQDGPWVVVFEPHCDQIDTVLEADLAQLWSLLEKGLRREESALGFVAYRRERASAE